MKTININRGILQSVSVYDSELCSTAHKVRSKTVEDDTSSSILPVCKQQKTYSEHHVKKHNHSILKTLSKISVNHQYFLTLQSTVSDPVVFRKLFDKFSTWFKRKYESGWMFYVFECSINNNIHCHAYVDLGDDCIDMESFETICRRKWAIINHNPDERLTKVTPYYVNQLGYVAKNDKIYSLGVLLNKFQGAQTHGFINKKNVRFVDKESHVVSDEIAETIAQFCLEKIKRYDAKLNRRPSRVQANKIRYFGAYAQHGITPKEMLCFNVFVHWEELTSRNPVADPSLLEDMPEWPIGCQFAIDDESPFLTSDEDEQAYESFIADTLGAA